MEPLAAFRFITIPIDESREPGVEAHSLVTIPFNVELLQRVEETIQKTEGRTWFRLKRSDKSIIEAFEDFCRPYLPAHFDFRQVQPTFCALFFSRVRSALLRSIEDCVTSMRSTTTPPDATDAKTTGEPPPSA
jgi:hypothetical protein